MNKLKVIILAGRRRKKNEIQTAEGSSQGTGKNLW